MITPAFELSQDPDFLNLSIRVPYTRTTEFDLYIDGVDFKFYAKPYFLRLTLPGKIVEDGREKATFDIDKGLFTLRVPKLSAGEHFEGLQMLTSLLAPKGSRSAKPLVEDMTMACSASMERKEEEDEDDWDWQVEQEVFMECSEEQLRCLQRYGFGNQRSGVFTRLEEELSDVIDVKNPDGTTAAERRQMRLEAESSIFCHDHYLADLFEDEQIQSLLKFSPWWSQLSPDQEGGTAVSFTDDDKEQLRRFTNRSFLLEKKARQQVWLGLVDVLLAYAYEVRTTEGEPTVESAWTIRKLSGTLCWLETYSSLKEVLVAFGRRVLCYPLYRHFSLVSAAVRDTALILQSGKACVLKCLLAIHSIFRKNDPAYILNDLYITDYCIWIQKVKSAKVTALADPLRNISLGKNDLELELEVLEVAAGLVEEEEKGGGSGGAPHSHGGEEPDSDDTDTDTDSSEESEDDSVEEGQHCTPRAERGGGGGTAEDSPLQPWPLPDSPALTAPAPSLIPPELWADPSAQRKPNGPPSSSTAAPARDDSSPLIQELGQMMGEGLCISLAQAQLGERHSSSSSSTQAQRDGGGSQPSAAAQRDGGGSQPSAAAQRGGGGSQPSAAAQRDGGGSQPSAAAQRDGGGSQPSAAAQRDGGGSQPSAAAQRDGGGSQPSAAAQRDGGGSQPSAAAQRDGGGSQPSAAAQRDGGGSQPSAAAQRGEVSATPTLLEPRPRRNPLLILNTDDSDNIDEDDIS
ncbi:protein SHQ1 homolog isoform X2 [Hypomesus transpacificus]|uniref:protein SHQ1 homolog isoform X2 n=1 Tax=Hypomesus transpacificus TaxID=137520 RepID=UPI001F07ED19|nr:protein SHQ1 homolog isoform X2 [Hypomesus transpacificus]